MIKKRALNVIFVILFVMFIISLAIFILFLIKFANPRELDDVTPGISCEQDLIDKTDVLWIVPKFNNIPISENKTWCSYILGLNKTIGMHGVTHEYYEFNIDRNQEYIEEGINIFEKCFGFKPILFKSPQLKISKNNKNLIKDNNMKLMGYINQITHKVYHCNDSDIVKNWFVDLF